MKIVVLDGYCENPGDLSWAKFEKFAEIKIYDRTKDDDVAERIGDADAILTNKTPVTKETIDKCRNLKHIGMLATGYNVVDVEYAKTKGIPVSNIPSYGSQAVAQFAISLLLEICHGIGAHSKSVKEGKWAKCDDWCYWESNQIELLDKTIGIIGYGKIGRNSGKIAKALGMKVLAFDKNKNDDEGIAEFVDLEELYKRADVILLHCPLFPATEGMINKDSISKMKDGVIIINNSRGALIVEQDLADALNTGKVYAAGIDVVSVEPINADNPLLKCDNCIITPHISWATKECRERIMKTAFDNFKAFLDGNPINVVN